jgi:hypothetical protein
MTSWPDVTMSLDARERVRYDGATYAVAVDPPALPSFPTLPS